MDTRAHTGNDNCGHASMKSIASSLTLVVALVVGLWGCALPTTTTAPAHKNFSSVTLSPTPERNALMVGGLAVKPPDAVDGTAWNVARFSPNEIVFDRDGRSNDHGWSAWVQTIRSPAPIDGYYHLARIVGYYARQTDDARFRDTYENVEIVLGARVHCLRRLAKIDDHGPAPYGAKPVRAVVTVDYFCAHPREPNTLVLVHLSERDRPGAEFKALPPLAEQFFAGVDFENW